MLGEPNRITLAIDKIAPKVEALSMGSRESLNSTLDLTFGEHFEYQQQQARAHVSGLLTTDEAQLVYIALGEVGSAKNGGWADGTSLAAKIVVTQLIGELLARRV